MLLLATEIAVAGHMWSAGRYLPTPVTELIHQSRGNGSITILFSCCPDHRGMPGRGCMVGALPLFFERKATGEEVPLQKQHRDNFRHAGEQ